MEKIDVKNLDLGVGESVKYDPISDMFSIPRSSQKVKLPSKLDENITYLIGYHLGDGYLQDYQKVFERTGKGKYELSYADSKEMIEQIIAPVVKELFGINPKIGKGKGNVWIAQLDSKIVHAFFSKIVHLPMGKRSKINVPSEIEKNDNLLKSFIAGFFDAEGYIFQGKKSPGLGMVNNDRDFLEKLKDILNERLNVGRFNIYKKYHQESWELKTTSYKVIDRFAEEIKFRHPSKINALALFDKAKVTR